MEEIQRYNDIELYDTHSDPLEMDNLAVDDRKNGELILAMNDKLNTLIDTEVGEDRGQMLPGGTEAGWDITPETMAP
jgi:arylsulfatase